MSKHWFVMQEILCEELSTNNGTRIMCYEFGHKTHTNNTLMCGAKESSNHYQSNHKQQLQQIKLSPSVEQPHKHNQCNKGKQ